MVIMVSLQNLQRKSMGQDHFQRQSLVTFKPRILINTYGKPVMKQYQRFTIPSKAQISNPVAQQDDNMSAAEATYSKAAFGVKYIAQCHLHACFCVRSAANPVDFK